MGDIPLVKIENLLKLSKKGQIHRIYFKMYKIADELAIHEAKNFLLELGMTKGDKKAKKGVELMINHKKERIEYHLNKMYELLEMHIKLQSKEEK